MKRPYPFQSPQIAMDVLKNAANAIGSPENATGSITYSMAAEFWNTYLTGLSSVGRKVGPADVLEMLALLAKAKAVTSDPSNAAHYIEQAACVAGAAVFANAQVPIPPNGENGRERGSQSQETTSENTEEDAATRRLAEKLKPTSN